MDDHATTPPPDDDPRGTMGMIMDLFDVLERHGYRKGDDAHVGRAAGYLGAIARIYSGEQDELGAGTIQRGGGWISGTCNP